MIAKNRNINKISLGHLKKLFSTSRPSDYYNSLQVCCLVIYLLQLEILAVNFQKLVSLSVLLINFLIFENFRTKFLCFVTIITKQQTCFLNDFPMYSIGRQNYNHLMKGSSYKMLPHPSVYTSRCKPMVQLYGIWVTITRFSLAFF